MRKTGFVYKNMYMFQRLEGWKVRWLMVDNSRSERSGICWEGGYAADVMQAGLFRWELQRLPTSCSGFSQCNRNRTLVI